MSLIGLSFDNEYSPTKTYDPSKILKGQDLINYYGMTIEYSDPEEIKSNELYITKDV